eukprot:gene39900-53955_t
MTQYAFAEFNGEMVQLNVYGDLGYGLKAWLQTAFRGNVTPEQQQYNTAMSQYFKKNMKLLLSPIGKYYIVGALLSNLHGIFNSTQTAEHFNVNMPTLQEYLATSFI